MEKEVKKKVVPVMVCYKVSGVVHTETFPSEKLAKIFQSWLNEQYGSHQSTKFIYMED